MSVCLSIRHQLLSLSLWAQLVSFTPATHRMSGPLILSINWIFTMVYMYMSYMNNVLSHTYTVNTHSMQTCWWLDCQQIFKFNKDSLARIQVLLTALLSLLDSLTNRIPWFLSRSAPDSIMITHMIVMGNSWQHCDACWVTDETYHSFSEQYNHHTSHICHDIILINHAYSLIVWLYDLTLCSSTFRVDFKIRGCYVSPLHCDVDA